MAVESHKTLHTTVHWTVPGRPAYDVLAAVLRSRRGADPLAPATVVTPSPAAAVALRRTAARDSGGLAAVGFHSLDALAERVAGPVPSGVGSAPGTEREVLVAAIRVALARDPGRFRAIAGHRSTWEALATAVAEVAALDHDARAAMASASGLGADVVRLADEVAERVPVGSRTLRRAAAARLSATPALAAEIGPVVLHAPGRLDAAAIAFLRALATATTVDIVAVRTGDVHADGPVLATVEALGGTPPSGDVDVPAPTSVVTTSDVDDEIRVAVQMLLQRVEAGVPLTSLALVHPAGPPYARAVAEVLSASSVPTAVPGSSTLAESAAGRVLLGVLEVGATRFARQAAVDLWASGVVVTAAGAPVPAAAVDERTRRLGIVRGRSTWSERIDARRRWLDAHPVDDDAPAEVVERRRLRRQVELAELDLTEQLWATTGELLDDLPSAWPDLAAWAARCLDTLCGPAGRRADWPTHEVEADTAIRTALGQLAVLEGVEPSPSPETVVDTLRATLDAPAPRRVPVGCGVLVTTLDDPPAVPLDTVVVVGLAEGHVPRVPRDDVLLGEHTRRAAGLPVPDDLTADQHRSLLSTLGAADHQRVLVHARSEQRTGRTQVPSRWLIDAVERMTGERPRTDAVVAGRDVAGIDVVHSHHAAIAAVGCGDRPALHAAERRLAALATAADVDGHPAVLEPVVSAGATLARGRAADAFTRFDGNVGDGIDVLAEGRNLSPTQLETYATCPRRWFLASALGVGEVERPEEIDRLQARDKGSLAHLILERFVGEAVDDGAVPAPGQAWGPADEDRLLRIADEEFTDFERRGLTGHPRWWAHDRQEITRVLLSTLRHDDQLRAEHEATPVAVELTFGRDDVPPLEVRLDDGRTVQLAGQADRVDTVPGGVMVHDYKFSSSSAHRGLDRPIADGGDPVAGGRRLQLLAYAEAAAQQRGVDRTSAWYWFLKPGHTGVRIGYEIGPEHRRVFREALRVLVDGIGAGLFPARSGAFDWWWGTNANCGWCEFDAICPADREDEWERVRSHPALGDVVRLSEEGSPAFLVTAPVEEAS